MQDTSLPPIKAESTTQNKFGTFRGVFLPTLLTILGAVLYLRTGWIVGNAGLGGAILIILMAHTITICTGLSVASIATNIRVRAGGAFSIIAQSLGLEVSGSVSVPFYFAQSIAVAFYIFAFTEGWMRIFPDHPEILVLFVVFALIYAIAYISAKLASRAQMLILVVQSIALTSVFLGAFALAQQSQSTYEPAFWGNFESGSFWLIFAVFFPGVTGILAGVNLSGNLKDPRRSIPVGMISAVLVAMTVYLLTATWFGFVASPAELVNNETVIVDKALFAPAVLAGLLAATFSAGLASLVGGPRILQALAQNNVVPNSEKIAETSSSGEPRQAMRVTAVITLSTLIFGSVTDGLNAIAPLMTMFYLITYGVLNAVVMIEQSLSLVSFRPRFRVWRGIPIIGFLSCLAAMFLINPLFSLAALIVIIGLYTYLSRLTLTNDGGDLRSGLFVSFAVWAAMRASRLPTSQERAWKPNLLVTIKSTEELLGSYRFLRALTYPHGMVYVLSMYKPGEHFKVQGSNNLVDAFTRDGIFARVAFVEEEDFAKGIRVGLDVLNGAFFHPNVWFNVIQPDTEASVVQAVLKRAEEKETGAILFAQHPESGLGREQTINVWIRDQSPDWEVGLRLSRLDLSLLLAYQIAKNWDGTINLITVIEDPAERENGHKFLNSLIDLGRMPSDTNTIVQVGDFNDFLPHAPRTDLNIFGTQKQVTLEFIRSIVQTSRASCIFVQDSGNESALA